MLSIYLHHNASSRLVITTMTGTTPNPTPKPTMFRGAHGRSEEVAAPLMLGVHTISGCRRFVHSTSRNGCPENQEESSSDDELSTGRARTDVSPQWYAIVRSGNHEGTVIGRSTPIISTDPHTVAQPPRTPSTTSSLPTYETFVSAGL